MTAAQTHALYVMRLASHCGGASRTGTRVDHHEADREEREGVVNRGDHLRPIERRILHMRDSGLSSGEIAQRVRRSAKHVERMIVWTEIPRTRRPSKFAQALESRVLALRDQGLDHEEIASKFLRGARNIRQVEALAYYRRAVALLRPSD